MRLFLQAGDECAQLRRARGALARRGARGQPQARIDLGEAAVSPDVLAPADDAIGERDVRLSAPELAHLEPRSAPVADIKAAAIAFGRDEHAIVAALDHFGEVGVEGDHGAPVL
jgi:hypothetical protein